jgi:hypothetical protein
MKPQNKTIVPSPEYYWVNKQENKY